MASSVQNVQVNSTDQEEIKRRMAANSAAWHTADAAGKKRLEDENRAYAAQLGSGVTFDSATGTWSGRADTPALTVPTAPAASSYVNDYSNYIRDANSAYVDAAIAEITNAYQQNVNTIDRAGEGVAEQYQGARNQTAGASELAKRSFNEYAATNGLNSGTGGQAELARNVTLQNNLNVINTAEANTIADLELQRANAETEYNNAIAKARAEGNAQLAEMLYQEAVRYDTAMSNAIQQEYTNAVNTYQLGYQQQRNGVSDSQWQQSFSYQQERDSVNDDQWQQSFDFQQGKYQNGRDDSTKTSLAEYGTAFLQQGIMPSDEMLAAMGISRTDAQAFIASVQAANAAKNAGTSTQNKPVLTYNQVMSAIENGNVTPAVKEAFEYYNGISYDDYYGQQGTPAAGGGSVTDMLHLAVNQSGITAPIRSQIAQQVNGSIMDAVLASMQASGASTNEIRAALREAYRNGDISQGTYNELSVKYLGN